jgi:hypothetical protein
MKVCDSADELALVEAVAEAQVHGNQMELCKQLREKAAAAVTSAE